MESKNDKINNRRTGFGLLKFILIILLIYTVGLYVIISVLDAFISKNTMGV